MENFDVSEKVIIESRYSFAVDKIIKITKAGNYKTENSGIFNKNGFERGGSDYGCRFLRKYDQKKVDEFLKSRKILEIATKIRSVSLEEISLSSLRKIEKIIDGEKIAN